MFSSELFAQLQISGPQCVIPGTEYQYNLIGSIENEKDINLCVEGGYLVTIQSGCYKGPLLNSFRIIWNNDTVNKKIDLTTASGELSLNIMATQMLAGGSIDSISKIQDINTANIPQPINCTKATGGNCSPGYVYQWEQSDDNLHWVELPGAANESLTFSEALDHTLFFRRRVTETGSNSIAYSDNSIVVVNNSPNTN